MLRDKNKVYMTNFYISKKLTRMFISYTKRKKMGEHLGIIFGAFGVASWTFIIKNLSMVPKKFKGKIYILTYINV